VKFSVTLGTGGEGRNPAALAYRDRALNPADVRDVVNLIHAAGRDLARYDIKVSGNPTQLEEFAAAGATWWGQWIPPGHPDDARKVIADGPPGHGRLRYRI
jgi:hypothetical protein